MLWKRASENIGYAIYDFLPISDSKILAACGGSEGEVWKSSNQGASWSLSFGTNTVGKYMCIGKTADDVIILGSGGTGAEDYLLWRSTDGGDSFASISTNSYGSQTATDIHDIACCYASSTGGILCCSTGGAAGDAELWQSTDSGLTWTDVTPTWSGTPSYVRRVVKVCDDTTGASNNGILLAGTNNNATIARSVTSGGSFTEVENISGEGVVYSFAVLKEGRTDGIVLAGTYNEAQIWKSEDSGETWTKKFEISEYSSNLDYIFQFGTLYDPASYDNQMVFAIAVDTTNLLSEIWRSRDQGETWAKWMDWRTIDDDVDSFNYLNEIHFANDTGTSIVASRRNPGTIYHWKLTGAPGDYLNADTSDCIAGTLTLSPHDAMVYTISQNQEIIPFEDATETRLDLDEAPSFFADVKWTNISASNSGTVLNYMLERSRGNGITRTFKWQHPTDGYTYVARCTKLPTYTQKPPDLWDINVTLKLIGIAYE